MKRFYSQLTFLLLSFGLMFSAHSASLKVLRTEDSQFISYIQFISELNDRGFIVLGEFHNQEPIQKAQAKIIEDKVRHNQLFADFDLMWEFLNFTAQGKIFADFDMYLMDQISDRDFIQRNVGPQNMQYRYLLHPLKKYRGEIFGINLDRQYKKQAMEEGLDSLAPGLIPENYHLGSDDYKERFTAAMGGHASEEVIEKYYMAQCLTDSVMSYHAVKSHRRQLSFIVAGSFHTDFNDGTVAYIKELTDLPVTNVKIVSEGLEDPHMYFQSHEKYGDYADYIVITE